MSVVDSTLEAVLDSGQTFVLDAIQTTVIAVDKSISPFAGLKFQRLVCDNTQLIADR